MDLAPVYSDTGPAVTLASHDVHRVENAIVAEMHARGFRLKSDDGDHVIVSRPLPALKVLLLEETIPGKGDLEIEDFHLEPQAAGIGVQVGRIEQFEISAGRFNRDPMMDRSRYEALRKQLEAIRHRVEKPPFPGNLRSSL